MTTDMSWRVTKQHIATSVNCRHNELMHTIHFEIVTKLVVTTGSYQSLNETPCSRQGSPWFVGSNASDWQHSTSMRMHCLFIHCPFPGFTFVHPDRHWSHDCCEHLMQSATSAPATDAVDAMCCHLSWEFIDQIMLPVSKQAYLVINGSVAAAAIFHDALPLLQGCIATQWSHWTCSEQHCTRHNLYAEHNQGSRLQACKCSSLSAEGLSPARPRTVE